MKLRYAIALALATALPLSGCIAYPKRVNVHDARCGITTERLTLEYEYLLGECPAGQEEACLAIVVGTAAASTVVSGSIVVASNTIDWLAEHGRCKPGAPRSRLRPRSASPALPART